MTKTSTHHRTPSKVNAGNRPPAIIFIFGGSGDLTHRKLMPALFSLYLDGYLPQHCSIVGVGRNAFSDTAYRNHIKKGVKEFSRRADAMKESWASFVKLVRYEQLDLTADKTYKTIAAYISNTATKWKADPTLIFYLSVAPQLAPVIAKKLHAAKLCTDADRSRIVFEKPFGHDLESATELNNLLRRLFRENQIYRIDHYLGKETVQNILALRFANALFEPVWNSNFIDHVQITAAETVSVENRGNYYEASGALRDMVQNHVLQMLCMVAMEAPISFAADEIRSKKLDVLRAIRKLEPEDIQDFAVRGQYAAGNLGKKHIPAYRKEPGVDPESNVETFAALKLYVDNWRWKDVPFYLRTGKCLSEKSTMVTIQFKPAPDYAFPEEACHTWRPNRLILSIAPQMDVRLRFQAKQPGPDMTLQPVEMVFNYTGTYGDNAPEAYETLLEDVIEGNPMLFMRADQVEAAWEVIRPVMEAWKDRVPVDFPNYKPGSWGPEDAEALIAKDGHHWASLPAK